MVGRSLQLVLALAIALTGLAGCSASPRSAAPRFGVNPGGVVELGGVGVAALNVSDGVQLIIIRRSGRDWISNPITFARLARGKNALRLLTYGGNTGQAWNTFVYGVADSSVARVVIDGYADAVGGVVVDGAWVVALQEKDLSPDQIHWRFLSQDGHLVEAGSGVFPPDA